MSVTIVELATAIATTGAVVPAHIGAELGGETTIEWTRTALLGILGYGLLAGAGALALAVGYRAVTVHRLPIGPAVLVGIALPAGWLTTEAIRHGTVVAETPLHHYATGAYLLGVLSVGTVVAAVGHRVGDHLACGATEITTVDADGPHAELVQSAGRSVVLTLPTSIDDAEGHPTIDERVERRLAGRDFRFPSDLSTSELRARLETRIETDYAVGYVRASLAEDGTVTGLAVGGRRGGLSSTLPPDRVAVAIAGDPSPGASDGDPVEIWTDDASSRLVATGTLRVSTGDVTTLTIDAADADAFTPGERYRLTTRPKQPSDAHALVSAIRGGDGTVTATEVEADGPLENEFAGWVPGTVLAIDRNGEVRSLPADNEPLVAEDVVYVFGSPDDLANGPLYQQEREITPSREPVPVPDRSCGR